MRRATNFVTPQTIKNNRWIASFSNCLTFPRMWRICSPTNRENFSNSLIIWQFWFQNWSRAIKRNVKWFSNWCLDCVNRKNSSKKNRVFLTFQIWYSKQSKKLVIISPIPQTPIRPICWIYWNYSSKPILTIAPSSGSLKMHSMVKESVSME